MLFLWWQRAAVASSNLIVGTSNSLKKRAKVFVMNLNTEKTHNKYYTRECISLFDGVESVVSVRFQVDTWLFGYDCYRINVAFC